MRSTERGEGNPERARGFGTLDQLFKIMTLRQMGKMKRHLPIMLFGARYWNEVIDFDALARHGTIEREDTNLFHRTNSVDEAYEIITRHLVEHALTEQGGARIGASRDSGIEEARRLAPCTRPAQPDRGI